MAEAFFDSNILLYLISEDARKASRSETILIEGGVISVQVLNEFTAVALRKHALAWPEIREVLSPLRAALRIEPLTEATYERASILSERYGYGLYDGLILAAAMIAGCPVLYSEDMRNGQLIDGRLTIQNPYR